MAPALAPGADGAEGWSFSVRKGPDVLARGQVSLTSSSQESGLPAGPSPASRTGGIAEALADADVQRGLGRGGPAVAALEEVARESDAPARGVATFDVVVNRSGSADVRLESADADFDAWSRLTRAMAEAVTRKSVRIPPGARGLRVTVRLDARVQWPNGKTPESTGTFARTTGLELGEGTMVPRSVPGVNVGVVGKVCSLGLTAGLAGAAILGGCDPEMIGAHTTRVVHGRELREVPL
jgi:hypothetical protein